MCCEAGHGNLQHKDPNTMYPEDFNNYCLCKGKGKGVASHPYGSQCCGTKTGDDNLCDRCRTACVDNPTECINKTEETTTPAAIGA